MYVNLGRVLAERGSSAAAIGFVVSLTALARAALGPWAGRAADRDGHRRVLLAGCALQAAGCSAYLASDGLDAVLVAARCLHGVGGALAFAALDAYVVTLVPASRRAAGLGVYTAVALCAGTSAVPLGELVLDHAGPRGFYACSAALAWSSVLLALGARSRPLDVPTDHVMQTLRRPELRVAWAIAALFPMAASVAATFLPVLLGARGVELGYFYFARLAVSIAIKLTLSRLVDRFGPRIPIAVGLGFEGCAMVTLALTSSPAEAALAGALSGVGWGFVFPAMYVIAIQRSPDGERGTAFAIAASANFVGDFVGGNLFGWIAVASTLSGSFLVSGTALLVSVPIWLAVRSIRLHPESRSSTVPEGRR